MYQIQFFVNNYLQTHKDAFSNCLHLHIYISSSRRPFYSRTFYASILEPFFSCVTVSLSMQVSTDSFSTASKTFIGRVTGCRKEDRTSVECARAA